jgi:hypothetical protein
MVKRRASDGGGVLLHRWRYFISSIVSILLRQRLYFTYDNCYHENSGVWGRSDGVVRKHMGTSSTPIQYFANVAQSSSTNLMLQ